MKRIVIVLLLIVSILFFSNKLFNSSFAYSYELDNSVLFYKDDYEELENDIKKYINNIDNYIVPNSSYVYSDRLVDNYDFLVRFAIDYILNNKEHYSNEIKILDKCLYKDKMNMDNYTSDYIDINKIYEITDFYFGVKDFLVINEDVCLVNDYVSLSDYTNDNFNLAIEDVEVLSNDNTLKFKVSYFNDNEYLYYFTNDNNVLKIENIEVLK